MINGNQGVAYERLGLSWQSCVSELGTAVVVDGSLLKVTPLRLTVVPPPMCVVQARLPAPAAAVAVLDADACDSGGCEAIAAITAEGQLLVFRNVEDDLWEETFEVGRWERR